jgi:hypothetical protein
MDSILPVLVSGILGGGLFLGLAALYRAFSESKEKKILADSVGAKTPGEIESISVATMTKALESAQTRISSLEQERNTDKAYYQGRISELNAQLETMQIKLQEMAQELAELAQKGTGGK